MIEDNKEISRANKRMLELKGYKVLTAEDMSGGLNCLKKYEPDLIILDILLPDGSGLDFCSDIRKEGLNTPILFLTALGKNDDIVNGLRSGGDDYLPKPYSFEVLMARIEALLRRSWQNEPLLNIGPYVFEHKSRQVFLDGENLNLLPKEYILFRTLAENRNIFLTAEELYEQVWGQETNGDIRTIYPHISRLRKKLILDDSEIIEIEQKRGKGYRLLYLLESEL